MQELPSNLPSCFFQVMEGANAPVDEAAEERKGGAGDLAKVRQPSRLAVSHHAANVGWLVLQQLSNRSRPAAAGTGSVLHRLRWRLCKAVQCLTYERQCNAAAGVLLQGCCLLQPLHSRSGASCSLLTAAWSCRAVSLSPLPCHPQCFLSAGDKQLAIFFHLPKQVGGVMCSACVCPCCSKLVHSESSCAAFAASACCLPAVCMCHPHAAACCRCYAACPSLPCLQLAADKGVTLKEWSAAVLAPVEGHQVGPEGRGRSAVS